MPRCEKWARAALPLVIAACIACVPARADQGNKTKLEAVQKALEQARHQQKEMSQQATKLAADMAQLRAQEITAAQSAQAHEAALTRLEAQLASLATQQKAAEAELHRRRREETQLVTALLHLARNPPVGVALTSGAPVDALRAGILLSAAMPPLVDRADLLGIKLNTLADLREQIRDAETRHRAESVDLAKEDARIRDLIAAKAALRQKAEQGAAESAAEAKRLAAQANDLRDLIARADAEARRREEEKRREAEAEKKRQERIASAVVPPPKIRPFSQARGQMLYPAAGKVVLGFGAAEPIGGSSKGMTIATRPGAQVVAPFDGRVVFAGPFKGYGQILIMGHGDGYHSLVAGLDRIDCTLGQWLVAGEPIGTMPTGEARPRLYLELRHDGQPINPLPWLATRDAKVKG